MQDYREMARAILTDLVPSDTSAEGLDSAIRLELLISALGDRERPRTLADLLRVLERISVGEVAGQLVSRCRALAAQAPNRPFTDFRSDPTAATSIPRKRSTSSDP